MDASEYVCGLGKVVANFHLVETVLRLFLCDANGESIKMPDKGETEIQGNSLTNFKSLSELINEYNGKLTPEESEYGIDIGIVKKRDAIAHGRPIATVPEMPVTLYKFGKPNKQGMVRIEFVEEINVLWLEQTKDQLLDYAFNIVRCARGRGYKTLAAP